jgi:hypothetical protein
MKRCDEKVFEVVGGDKMRARCYTSRWRKTQTNKAFHNHRNP